MVLFGKWKKNNKMAKVLISIEISKPYAHWKNVFDSLESERAKVAIKNIYVGHKAGNEKKCYILFEVSNPEVLKKFMFDPKNAARMNEAGLIRESSKITVCSD